MKFCLWLLLGLISSIAGNPIDEKSSPPPLELPQNFWSLSVGAFDQKLFSQLRQGTRGNFIYSPLSLHMALLQLRHAAPANSSSRQELDQVLNLPSAEVKKDLESNLEYLTNLDQYKAGGAKLSIANKIFVDESYKIKEDFQKLVEKNFLSSIGKENFKDKKLTTETINNFVKNETNGLITDVISEDDLNDDPVAVLVNAIYFSGKWKYTFNETSTFVFHSLTEEQEEVPSMSMTADIRYQFRDDLASILFELPYQQDGLSMIIILTLGANSERLLNTVQTKIEERGGLLPLLEQFESKSRTEERKVIMPKFKLNHDVSKIEEYLQNLGLKSIFIPSTDNLSNLGDGKLYVSKVGHKASIEVNEVGSEAAAASTIVTNQESGSLPLEVNRPFIFFIVDKKAKVPLFVGQVVHID